MKIFLPLALLACLLLAGLRLVAEEKKPTAAADANQAKEVLAILQARCSKCHGAENPKAKLKLLSLEDVANGSKRGPVVNPGKLADSSLWQQIHDEKMPPKQPL